MKNSGSKIILSKLADTIAGQSPESKYYSSNEGVPFLQGNRTFGHLSPKIDTFTKKITKLASKGDLLISVRAPVGDLNFAPCELCVGRGLAIIKSKNGDNNFVYYSLKNSIKNLIRQGASTTYNSITSDDLNNFELIVPKNQTNWLPSSKLLSLLDKKIFINNKINSELERMAKTLYDYWFVQFDFPDENGKPYKDNGGKMVFNDNLKREIPEGWELLELSDIIIRSGTGLNPRQNFKLGQGDNYYVTIKNIEQNKVILDDKCDKVNNSSLKIIDERSDLKPGDILFTSIQPVGITYFIHETPKNWNINESVFTIRPNYQKITSEYLFMLLSSQEMKVFTKNSSAGSIHKGIRHTVLKTFKLAYKNKDLIGKFSKIIQPTLQRIDKINNENQKLSELRDWLLPMLMNGQVQVK